ncbi:type I restriction-modification system subunit M [Novosphingobium sp. Leaf2]|uniref:type I restriction-modification system subunit M n=1 Tax=Novosphingobium sp. Leaf2 TaxID=1735670 RepID=UPI0006FD07B2|nr:class I SAM-dependent DNA methyltransferase [Novosphingobium sp. Leaf2]KQM19913.1 type I restriction endonuclease subunit M [Novosphingobium sp. Leaf2]
MAVKKSQIYSSLWKSCDALRGGMDASQYKDYILTLLFLKYVSDRSLSDPDAQIEVPEGCHFADMVKLKGTKDIGEGIDKIIAKVAETNGLGGVIDIAKFNDPAKLGDGKDMVDRLSKLMDIFSRPELDFRKNRAEGDDILGDAYEYLMRHFAADSGKSKGQFYTPAEVSRIMAKVVGINRATTRQHTIYDPTCGSGSLLLKANDAAPDGLSIYGQEKDVATYALARMNMVIHNCADAELWRENTLTKPYHKGADGKLKQFDFIVANPPFSDKAWSTGLDDNDKFGRFAYGTPPAKNGDYAYLLHVLASMKSTGKAAVVMPHGVLFRGNAEADIRRELLKRGYIKGIIGLPANLFYGTGIPACLIVLDKTHAGSRTGIFMIDASKGYTKDGPKNRLRSQDVHKIIDVFERQTEIAGYSRIVLLAEINTNDGNLNIPRYIDGSEAEDLQDIDAHLRGGIPTRDVDALQEYWDVMPGLRADLFGPGSRSGYLASKVEPAQVRTTIHAHPEFDAFATTAREIFAAWREANIDAMRDFDRGHHPSHLIVTISEDLLARFRAAPLIDGYDAYQHIMTYWSEIMQDDAYQITTDGWPVAKVLRELLKDADGKFSEEPDLVLGSGRSAKKLKAEIIPPALIVARYFAKEQAEIEALETKAEEIDRQIEELEEEYGGEDGLFADAKTDTEKLTAASVKARLRTIKGDRDADEERKQLQAWSVLSAVKAGVASEVNQARTTLNAKVASKYAKLSDGEAIALAVEDKWLAAICSALEAEIDHVSQALTGRIKTLNERYAVPLPVLSKTAEQLEKKVASHLSKMGFR